jgi:4'-phosphopantetheinyl transferase EntD
MLEELLPAEVIVVEAFADLPGAVLFPEEDVVVSRAVDNRRREFTTTRLLARSALSRLGFPPTAILPGDGGAPTWPPGAVGSMTHCTGYRAAAAARTRDVHAIGIDAEEHDRLPAGVLDLISDGAERLELVRLAAQVSAIQWDRLLFSAKESVYKTWFPLTGRWLDFAEVRVTTRPDGTFTARFLVPGPVVGGAPLTTVNGRWLVRDGLVLTAIAVSRCQT